MQKSLVKNILYKILLNLFNLVLPLLVGTYVLRTLKPISFGTVQFAESIFNYFFIFAVFGVYQYGLREMSKIKEDKQKVNQLFTSLFTVSIVTSTMSLAAYLFFAYLGYGKEAVFPVLLIFGFYFVGSIFYVEWVNEAYENYGFITAKTIIIRIFYVAFLLLLVKNASDYKQYAMLLVGSTFLNNIVSFIYIKRKVKLDFSHLEIKRHLKPLLLVVIFSNANVLYTQLDRYMLGEFVNTEAVSYYAASQQMMGIIHTLLLSIIQVSIPRLSYLSGTEDEGAYVQLLNTISKVYFAFLFPAGIGLFIISDVGVLVYGGQAFVPAAVVLSVFAIYMISLGVESILANQIIYVKGKEQVLVKLIFLCGFLNLGLKVLLIQVGSLTPTTAIATTAFSNYVLVALEYWFIRKTLKVEYKLFTFSKLKYLLYALTFVPISYGIRLYVDGAIWLFLTLILVSALVYAAILIATKDEVYHSFLNKLKARLGRRAASS